MLSGQLPILIALLAIGCSSGDRIPKDESLAHSPQAVAELDAGVSNSASSAAAALDASASSAEQTRVQAYLDSRYTAKDVWRSFETKLGQTIDCIDWFAQPGVRALAAAGTPITEIPSPVTPPKGLGGQLRPMPDWGFDGAPDKNGVPRACPPKTAPFVRITVDEILAAGGLDAYLRRNTKSMPDDNEYADAYAHDRMRFDHSNAEIYYGVGTLQIYNPSVKEFTQSFLTSDMNEGSHSISQLWMTSGNADWNAWCYANNPSTPYKDRTTHNCTSSNWMQTVETGWWIGTGDSYSHYFIYTTRDGYHSGCYASQPTCSDYQTSQPFIWNQFAFPVDGQLLPPNPDPTYGWRALELHDVSIYNPGRWHVIVAGSDIGYYPDNWFSGSMRTTATEFRIGGEVADQTKMWIVPMGSGASASNGSQAAYIHDTFACSSSTGCVGDMVPMDTINGGLGKRGVYNHSTYNPNPGQWGNAFYFGNVPGVFWNANYGYDAWNPLSYDWASGYWKGECGYGSFPRGSMGVPMTGVSENAFDNPPHFAHAVLCNSAPVETDGNSCRTTDWLGTHCNSNGNWDSGYFQSECWCGAYVIGISQDSSGFHSLLCCPGQYLNWPGNTVTMSQSHCRVEEFYNGNSPDFLWNTPDWDPFFYKGQCPAGYYVAGVSTSWSGAPHRLLCCDMSDER